MVTFCTVCGTSLPLADLLLQGGKELTSPFYKCPECGDFAAEEAHAKKAHDQDLELEDGQALVLTAGAATARPLAEALSGLAAHPAPAWPAPAHGHAEELEMPPDTDLMQPNLPAVPAVDEEVQEDLPEDLGEDASESGVDEEMDFIERPE